jgi:hypothetical protein
MCGEFGYAAAYVHSFYMFCVERHVDMPLYTKEVKLIKFNSRPFTSHQFSRILTH